MTAASSPPKPVVLVVDDEAALRTVIAMSLARWDVEVLEASTGLEALEIFRRHRDRIGFVLMDVNMPGLSGPETLESLRQIDPDVRCCFMTGNAANRSECGNATVIDKPFDLEVLARLVQPPRLAA